MTWSAHFTVQDVSDGPAPIDVLCVANADETVKPFAHIEGSQHQDYEAAGVTSNTEGVIRSIELKFVLDQDTSPLKVGDTFSLSGHFS